MNIYGQIIQCAAKPRFRHRAGVLVIKSKAKLSRSSDDECRFGDELVIIHPETQNIDL